MLPAISSVVSGMRAATLRLEASARNVANVSSRGALPSTSDATPSSSLIATLYPRFALLCVCALCAFYFSFARLLEGEVDAVVDDATSDSTADAGQAKTGRVVSLGGHRERR